MTTRASGRATASDRFVLISDLHLGGGAAAAAAGPAFADPFDQDEALLQFLYMAPIGLMQANMDGEILMVNPLCAQLLMPLSRDAELSNLFLVLERLAPDLRHRLRGFDGSHGMIVE